MTGFTHITFSQFVVSDGLVGFVAVVCIGGPGIDRCSLGLDDIVLDSGQFRGWPGSDAVWPRFDDIGWNLVNCCDKRLWI